MILQAPKSTACNTQNVLAVQIYQVRKVYRVVVWHFKRCTTQSATRIQSL